MTTPKVVKSLHGIVPVHTEEGHVRDTEITSDLEPFRLRQGQLYISSASFTLGTSSVQVEVVHWQSSTGVV